MQTLLQKRKIRRNDENKYRVRSFLLDHQRPLDLDFQHDVAAGIQFTVNGGDWRAVIIADIFGIFQQRTVVNHGAEPVMCHKIIALSVDFTGARLARRSRNGVMDFINRRKRTSQNGPFSGPGRTGDNK